MVTRITRSPLPAGHVRPVEHLEPRTVLSDVSAFAGDVVLTWNDIAVDALQFDRTYAGPVRAARNMAIVQASVYDALNGIEQTHTPFFVTRAAPSNADPDAAVASAAARALTKLFPQQKRVFAAELKESLAEMPADKRSERAGVRYGRYVADRIVAWRRFDGSAIDAFYEPGTRPGDWQPTPPDFGTAVHPGAGDMATFSIPKVDDFMPVPPPRLDSAEYAAAYNEVYDLGDRFSPFRTEEQTEIGLFWAYDRPGMGTPLVLFNQVLQTIAVQEGNSPSENARLFATANVAMADAGIVTWACKYLDNFWRPVTGIRSADLDGNPDTVADPDWEPLGAPDPFGDGFTPPFPAYTSGHATFGAALFRTLENFYGTDAIPFTLASDELPGVTRSYASFSQAAEENGDSRIYLGVHWRFDDTYGQICGREIADHVFDSDFTPVA